MREGAEEAVHRQPLERQAEEEDLLQKLANKKD